MKPTTPAALCLLTLALAMPAHAGRFADMLATLDPGAYTGTETDFVQHVSWIANPEPRHYVCTEGASQATRLELWQGKNSRARDTFGEQALIYGENGSVRVLAMTDDSGEPRAAAYFMLPSGETHLFRLDASARGVTRSGKRFDCRESAQPEM